MSESFRLDQPRANDLVGNPLLIAGSGGGFEANIAVRVLDGNGQVLVETSVTNTNLTSAWQTSVSLPEPPPTNRGVVQVGPSTGADEAPRHRAALALGLLVAAVRSVMPLPANQYPGQRAIGTDGKVDERAVWAKPRVRAVLTRVTASLPEPPPGPPTGEGPNG